MTTRRFFALVWRANAIVLLLTAILACTVLAYGALQIYREATRTRQATDIVNVAGEQIDRSTVELGQFERVEGFPVLRAPLRLQQQYGFSSGSKETTSIQNYLFYDPADGSARWLVPRNTALFLSTHELPDREYGRSDKAAAVVAVVYVMVETDTDGDRRLTAADAKVLAVSSPAGMGFTRLLTGVVEANSVTLIGEKRILILYTTRKGLNAAEIDVDTRRVVRDAPPQVVKGEAGK